MQFLRRRIFHALVALFLAGAGFGVTRSFQACGDSTSVWPFVAHSQSEFERVANAINGKPVSHPVRAQRTTNATLAGAEQPVVAEPKVIEIEYDAEGNPIDDRSGIGLDEWQDDASPVERGGINLDRADDASQKRAAFRAAGAVAYQDATLHYAIDLPLAWQEMSQQELSQINRGARALGFGNQASYQAGFRRKNTRPGSCPYILVSAKPGRIGSYDDVERELEKTIPSTLKRVEGALRSVATNLSINGAALDRSTNRIVFRSQLDIAGVGTMQALTVGHIGSQGVIFVHCYSLDNEFAAWLPTFERINDSFVYEDGYEFAGSGGSSSGLAEAFSSVLKSGWTLGALLGAGAGAIVGMMMLACRKPRREHSELFDVRDNSLIDAATLLEQNRIKTDEAEMRGMRFDEQPGPKPASILTSVSHVASFVIPLAVLGTAGCWCYYHGAEFGEKLPEMRQAATAWCIEKITGQTPDEIYSDGVARVRAVTAKSSSFQSKQRE